jgi:hypothetical protein
LSIEIRAAVAADALAACEVLRRSIAELCVADHDNDSEILGRWLANKTPEIVASWIARSDNSVLVAVEGDTILAVGSVTDGGERSPSATSPRMRGFAASAGPCLALSKLAPPSAATSAAPCTAP